MTTTIDATVVGSTQTEACDELNAFRQRIAQYLVNILAENLSFGMDMTRSIASKPCGVDITPADLLIRITPLFEAKLGERSKGFALSVVATDNHMEGPKTITIAAEKISEP